MRLGLASLVIAAAGLAVSCARILGFGDVPTPAPAGEDGGDDAGDASEKADVDAGPCVLAHAPGPPAQDDPSDAGDLDFVVALHSVDLGLRPDGGAPPVLGYDVDGIYTCCMGAPESCQPPVKGPSHCDQEGGVDDQTGLLLQSVVAVTKNFANAGQIDQELASGRESILLRVQHYNGQANDTQVATSLYGSDGTALMPDGGNVPPKWDGSDVWTIDNSFVLTGADGGILTPTRFDTHAYVSGGVLVTGLDFPIPLQLGSFVLQLTGTVVTGRIVPEDGSFGLAEGRLAGRWTAPNIFAWLQSAPNPLGKGPVCKGSSEYTFFKASVCAALDVTGASALDRTGAACDSLSAGAGFTADPARMGPVTMWPPSQPPCPDAGTDDCTMP